MSDRYCIQRDDGKVLCRRSSGTYWTDPWIGDSSDYHEPILLTKEGAEQMALTVGGKARKIVSPTDSGGNV